MAEALSIPNRPPSQDITDIRFLRETGLALLQKYSGNLWTDYNTHDPGVTILEVLCLALAEVGYRAEYDITELLGKEAHPGNGTAFLPPQTVLPTAPVTEADMRKQLLDLEGVRNVRIRKCARFPEFEGLYDLEVRLADDAAQEQEAITQKIRSVLDRYRQPGQEFVDIRFLGHEYIGFELDIEVNRRVSSSEFFHTVASAIEAYLSPAVHFDSAEELMKKQVSTTEIFDGPMLKNGVVTSETLDASRLRKTIYTSDLIGILMRLPDVRSVRRIIIRSDSGQEFHWSYEVADGKVPRISHDQTQIMIRYKGAEISNRSLSHIRINRDKRSLPRPFEPKKTLPEADNDKLREYASVLDDLPDTYGIGEYGLSSAATPHREALAHQLRGYLSIFDQLLSGSFAQLASARHLLAPAPVQSTYVPGDIRYLGGGEFLYKPFTDTYLSEYFTLNDKQHLAQEWEDYIAAHESSIRDLLHAFLEDHATFLDRRNRALNHLLARYGYDFSYFEYVAGMGDEELIAYKERLLSLLPHNDQVRNVSEAPRTDYLQHAIPFPGFEQRIALLSGIRAAEKKSLSAPVEKLFAGGTAGVETDVEVFNVSAEEAIDVLFAWGGQPEMYHADASSEQAHLVLYDPDRQPRARFTVPGNDSAFRERLAESIRRADEASEGFHFIDHLLLRPTGDLPYFGFDVAGSSPLFTCAPSLTREAREKTISDFLDAAGDEDAYIIRETTLHQFRLSHKASSLLQGLEFYKTRDEARQAVGMHAAFFRNLDPENRREAVVLTNAFRDLFADTDDPFSGIVTFVLPSWPSRFSNKAYRKYIEEVIARETAAHLVVNIRWFCFEKMKKFEAAWSAWLEMYSGAALLQREKLERLNRLLDILAE